MKMPTKPIPELTDRQLKNFWAKVDKRGPDECWEWTAGRNRRGYGLFGLACAPFLAHRVAYCLSKGVDPSDSHVCHRCDNPKCCNPGHLFLGTHRENMRDCKTKGRTARGERASKAVLTETDVLEIRTSKKSANDLAEIYSISACTISSVRHGRVWAHAGGLVAGYDDRATLTERDVLAIRRSRETGVVLASKYHVSTSVISEIQRGLSWKHVGGPIRSSR